MGLGSIDYDHGIARARGADVISRPQSFPGHPLIFLKASKHVSRDYHIVYNFPTL